MNNNIEESYVTFDVAKLLKEKEFDVFVKLCYHTGFDNTNTVDINGKLCGVRNKKEFDEYNLLYAPTTALAIAWIRENFGIHIHTKRDWDNAKMLGFESVIDYEKGFIDVGTYSIPEEAENAAIHYTLTTLV